MNPLASLLALAAASLAAFVGYELRPQQAPYDPARAPLPSATPAPPTQPAPPPAPAAALVDTLLARPLFSPTRRPANLASPAATPLSAAPSLPRMTAILIDGPRRSAIFAAPSTPDGKPAIVAEGGRIGPFTVQTIEPQQVTVIGPEGKRTIRTSFDPTLSPPALPLPVLGAPQFPGIAPVPGYGTPQSAGTAR